MDNKNNRLHYWNVKDFLEKQPEIVVPPSNPLKDVVNNVLRERSEFKQSNFVNNTNVVNSVSNTVNAISQDKQKYANNNAGQSKNTLANPFYIVEQSNESQPQAAPAQPTTQSGKTREQERYDENVRKRKELEATQKKNREDSARRNKQDEANQYSNETGKNLELDSEGVPVDNATNRAALKQYRKDKDFKKNAEYYSNKLAELSKKDPSQLSDRDAAELAMARIMMKPENFGENLQKEISDRAKKKVGVKGSQPGLSTEPNYGTGDVQQADIDSMSAADAANFENETSKQANTRIDQFMSGKGGYSSDDLRNKSVKTITKSRDNDLISGTSMTYSEFRNKFGEEYDVFNRKHQNLVRGVASNFPDQRISPLAQETMHSVYDFNKMWAAENERNTRAAGKEDRRYDKAVYHYHRYDTDPKYRKEVDEAEKRRIENDPEFKRDIEEYKRKMADAKRADDWMTNWKNTPEGIRRPDIDTTVVPADYVVDLFKQQNPQGTQGPQTPYLLQRPDDMEYDLEDNLEKQKAREQEEEGYFKDKPYMSDSVLNNIILQNKIKSIRGTDLPISRQNLDYRAARKELARRSQAALQAHYYLDK